MVQNYSTSLFIALFISLFLFQTPVIYAQNVTGNIASSKDLVYYIQIAAFKQGTPGNYDNLHDIGELYVEDDQVGLKIVVMGYYPNKEAAKQVLQKVYAAGYNDAFVDVRLKEDAIMIVETPSPPSTTNQTTSLLNNSTIQPASNAIANELLPNQEVYVIRLGSYRHIKDVPYLGIASQLGSIIIDETSSGNTTYLLGSYSSRSEVDKVIQQLKQAGLYTSSIYRLNHTFLPVLSTNNAITSTPPISNNTTIATQSTYTPPTSTPSTNRFPTYTPPASTTVSTPSLQTATTSPSSSSPLATNSPSNSGANNPSTNNNAVISSTNPTPPEFVQIYPTPPSEFVPVNPTPPSEFVPVNPTPSSEFVPVNPTPQGQFIPVTPSAPVKNPVVDFGKLDALFEKGRFHMFNIGIYNTNTSLNTDPVLKEMNKQLAGKRIDLSLTYLLENETIKTSETPNFYAISSYPISPQHIGYIIRQGGSYINTKNDIYLYIYDKTIRQFIAKEVLSTIDQNATNYREIKTLITDLDADGTLDLLTYYKESFYGSDGQLTYNKDAKAKVWKGNQFKQATIERKEELIKQLNLF